MLDGKAVTPLYVQLMTEIEAKIMKGVYQPGERLQSESEMAKTFGVSIITVRNAVSALVAAVLFSIPGRRYLSSGPWSGRSRAAPCPSSVPGTQAFQLIIIIVIHDIHLIYLSHSVYPAYSRIRR